MKVGDRLYCINDNLHNSLITFGKIYKVLSVENNYINVETDNKMMNYTLSLNEFNESYYGKWFITENEYRKNKLKLLDEASKQ